MPKDEVTPRRLDKDTDRRLRALDRSAHAPVKKAPAKGTPRGGQQGGVTAAVALIVSCVGLFLWGFSRGASAPDGRWLLAVLIIGVVLAGLVLAGLRYRATERAGAAYTARIEGRLEQDTTGDHIWDA